LLGAAATRRVRAGLSRSLRAAGTRPVTVIWRL
jgi:hypothetical protein